MSYLQTKFHENWISSFRGVAMTRFWDGRTDGQTDGVTRLLDLLSPLATQVKRRKGNNNNNFLILTCINLHFFYNQFIHFKISKDIIQIGQWNFSLMVYISGLGLKYEWVTGMSYFHAKWTTKLFRYGWFALIWHCT